MTSYDTTSVDVDVPVDDAEATEAEGVASERDAPPLSLEEAQALDLETLEGLDEKERKEIEDDNAEIFRAADAEVTAAAAAPAAAGPGSGPVRLSRNFLLSEFHCCRGHCTRASVPSDAVPALRRLVKKVLQPMRDEFGRCSVNSGYRNAAHNSHVRGVTGSRHRYDEKPRTPAADLTFARGTVDEWAAMARERLNLLGDIGGVGRYHDSNFVHVDLGPKRTWTG